MNLADDPGRKELLKSAYRKIEELRARLAAGESRRNEPVAVVGMACRFPGGVVDPDSYWRLLSSGADGVTEIPPDRWNIDDYYDPDPDAPGKMYVRRGGFIDNVRGFDPLFFHVSPQEASSMDPQQRVLLETTWEALENAGLAPDQLSGSPVGVFIGLAGGDYSMMAVLNEQELLDSAHAATGSSPSIAAGRISYFFGLRGPCMAVDTACASALTATHLAVQSLREGGSKMALAGSINLIIAPAANVVICKARMLSADGKCKTFDASADGYVRSEGCGVLVLKLLSQAQADGDRILAVIRGTACNQDGRTNGITAPNGNAQREVIQAALAASGLSPREIDYLETHGTGTSLGDPIEVQALGEVFGGDRPADDKLVLGAVKTNVGHLEAAAGMAALCKVILALQKEQIPANLHFRNPNPLIPWDSLPFLVPTKPTPWPAAGDRRLAGVSAFGFSGTNVHMILEEAPRLQPAANPEQDRPCHLLTLSAQAPRALSELAERHAGFLNANPRANLADVCFTANTGRAHLAHRLAVIATTVDDLKAQLARPSVAARAPSQPPPLGLFIAAESLTDIHRQLYLESSVFKAAIDACDSAALELFGASFPAAVWKQPADLPSPGGEILSFALAHAMAAQWREWGINPAAVSGCGVAAVFAGALTLRDGLRLAADPRAAVAWAAPRVTLLPAETADFEKAGMRAVLAIGEPPRPGCIAASGGGWADLLDAIAKLYVAGVAIDWKKFESPWPRRRLALPTYPFQRQECWLKFKPQGASHKSSQKNLHPLLGRRIYSPQLREEIVFEAEFNAGNPPLLKDHRFFSTVVVPAAAMLEMGNAAGRIALGNDDVSLTDFVIEHPLLLPEGRTNLVQTVLTPEAGGYWFVIHSAEINDAPPAWKRHCGGKLAIGPAAPVAETGALDRLRARYNKPADPEWFYTKVAEAGVDYGKSFRVMHTIWHDEAASLVLLRMPADVAKQAAGYGAHPGLLDGAVQAIGVSYSLEHPERDGKELYMPVAVDAYRLRPIGASEVWCLAALRPERPGNKGTIVGDLQFYSTAGEAIGELRGVHYKRNARNEFLREAAERGLAGWLFEPRWEPLPMASPCEKETGSWLIVSDGNPVAAEFADVVRRRRGRATIASPRDCEEALQAGPLRGAVYFAAQNGSGQETPRAAGSRIEQLLHLTHALARGGAGDPPALTVVTEGFQAPGIGTPSGLEGSGAWGLGRVIAAELPDLHCRMIDLDPSLPAAKAAVMLADELASESDENQVALGEGKRLGLRLERAGQGLFDHEDSGDPRRAVEMEIGARGDLRQLRFVSQQPSAPGPGEVRLRLLATALNFRDVLNALGMYPGNPGALGVECVGEIVALGPDVSGWSVGEQVLAIPHRGYCTYANAPVNMLFRRPANLSLADAATLLVAYLTAAYSLSHLGGMKAGDRVLIHAAAGGVGLAAVQLAQQAGAEIFATAGSPAKREYLRRLGVPHVMDSRSLDFAAKVRELTRGQGVDLVLNSLTGHAIVEGLSLLRPGGGFLEIGKNELLGVEQVAGINAGARYYVIDLLAPFRETPELMRKLFAAITDSLAAGAIRPLPHRVFSLPDAPRAFRCMAAAKHIGKVIVVHQTEALFEPSGTYLITGGLGGLGLALARWMAEGGARRIVLAGRSAPNPAAEKTIRELEALGAKIIVARADVGERRQLAHLLAAHASPSAPLRGVIHAAGVLDDGALLLQDWQRFERVLKPKIEGAWNLHELTLQTPLDFFVLFSSGAGLLGNPGQSNYAAGNVFLDALALARHAAGLPALSVNWGAWAGVGMAAALHERHHKSWDLRGLSVIEVAQGLAVLQMLMTKSRIAQMAVLPFPESAWSAAAGRAVPPLVRNLVARSSPESAAASSGGADASERLRKAAPEEKRNVLIELVGEMVLDVFGLDRQRSIPPDQNLTMLGMDSLLAIQLSNRLKTSFAAAVPSTLTFQYPTIEAIADYLLTTLSTAVEAQSPAADLPVEDGKPLDSHRAEKLLANIDQLSDSDIEALLGAMEEKPVPE